MPQDGECNSSRTTGAAAAWLRRWGRLTLVIAVAVLGVSGGLGVSSADAASAKVRKACAADYKRLCPHYKVGSARMRACMEAKQNEISSRCIDALIDSGEVSRRGRRR